MDAINVLVPELRKLVNVRFIGIVSSAKWKRKRIKITQKLRDVNRRMHDGHGSAESV